MGASLAIVKSSCHTWLPYGVNGVGCGRASYTHHTPAPCLVFSLVSFATESEEELAPADPPQCGEVWKAEQKHEAERKKIEELQRELREERGPGGDAALRAEDVGAVK